MNALIAFIAFNVGIGILIKVGLVLVLAGVAAFCLKKQSAALRHWIWTSAILSSLTIPIWTLSIEPTPPTHPLTMRAIQKSMVWTPDFISDANYKNIFDGKADKYILPDSPRLSINNPEHRTLLKAIPPKDRRPVSPLWMQWLVAAWALGSVLLLARLCYLYYRARKLITRASPITDDHWHLALKQALGSIPIKKKIGLKHCSKLSSPALAGIFRNTILIPDHTLDWNHQEKKTMLMHELAHAKRNDNLIDLLHSMAIVLFWPNVLVFLAKIPMHRIRELAADDRLIKAKINAPDYSQLLLSIATTQKHTTAASLMASMSNQSALGERISRALSQDVNRTKLSIQSAFLLLFFGFGGALSAANIGINFGLIHKVEKNRYAYTERTPLGGPILDGNAGDDYAKAEALLDKFIKSKLINAVSKFNFNTVGEYGDSYGHPSTVPKLSLIHI